MRVVFLPVRGGIRESFADSISCSDLHDILISVSSQGHFSVKDLSLCYYCFDSRFGTDCYLLCTSRFDDVLYPHPQAVGYIYFGLTKACMNIRLNSFFDSKK